MNLKAFKEEDLQQKPIAEMLEEISPKYQRDQVIKKAYRKEKDAIDELEAALNEL